MPHEKRRPEDEHFDLTTIEVLRTTDVLNDGSIVILTLTEGTGNVVDREDTVYYRHETRFDNGQLVDLSETRKVGDKFIMSDHRYHDFLRHSFFHMKKGEIAFVKIGPAQHHGMYHKTNLSMQRTQEERDAMRLKVGQDIYIRVQVTNIKRDPMCDAKATWDEKITFFNKVREVGKELCAEAEYSNAKNLYSRCIGVFKNMPKKQRESLDEEMNNLRNDILNILNLNTALCLLKKKMYAEAIKHC